MRKIRITRNLRERVGAAKAKTPCASRLKHGRVFVEVAHRPFHDGYNFTTEDGTWLASFDDCSHKAYPNVQVENLRIADGVEISFEEPVNIKS